MSEDIAKRVFSSTKYQATKEDIKRLSDNIILLEERGLSKLNQRLIEGGRGIWNTIAEHNFAVELALSQNSSVPIKYEPPEGLKRPLDFKIEKDGITYWLQMKKLAALERDNRQEKAIEQIKRAVKDIKIEKFFGCDLSSGFAESDISALVQYIKNMAAHSIEGQDYFFPCNQNQKAKITFWSPKNINLSHLTLGTSGDIDIVDVTGLSTGQIKQSLCKAASAFDWEVNQNVINLVIMEADNQRDINICDAVFGTEFEVFRENRHSWCREDNGFFHEEAFSNRVAGVIAIKRKERKPICHYYMILYINDAFKNHIDNINMLLSFGKVVHRNMRTPMGQANFKLE